MVNASVETVLGGHSNMELPRDLRFILDSFQPDRVPPSLSRIQQAAVAHFFNEQKIASVSGASVHAGEEATTKALAEMALLELTLPNDVLPQDWGIFVGPHIFPTTGLYHPDAVMLWQPNDRPEQSHN
ncbi:MAG TPA: hypothetical protein VII55_01295 [Candidatus Saccharimonadales bacterium]